VDEFTYIDVDTVRSVVAELSKSSDGVDRQIAEFLDKLAGDVNVGRVPPSPMAQLGNAVKHAGLFKNEKLPGSLILDLRTYQRTMHPPERMMKSSLPFASEFIARLLREIRNAICKPQRDRNKLDHRTQATLVVIATAAMQMFHLSNATANGFAVLTMLTIGRCTKKAFCDMTDEEVLKAMKKSG
jgi:hypothetical protein